MKLRRKRTLEVPPKIRCSINCVTAVPLENIQEPLKSFTWEFDKGDFHHWVDLFNHFDSFFEKYVKPRKDLQIDDGFLDSDPPFPREAVLQILRVIRIILDNCTNKHFYSSYEQHLSSLLASTDPDVVEATLDTLATFLKKTIGKYSIRDTSLNSKLFALAQGWGGKEEGLGLITSAVPNGCDPISNELGCALHFEFYAVTESESDIKGAEPLIEGLQIIHLSDVHKCVETDLELLHKLVTEYKVPSSLRFSLLTRLRFARAFGSFGSRQQYTCIRLYAFIVLIQASGDADDLVSFFNAEPGFINELVSLLSYEDAVLEKIRVLCLHSLAALCQDRSRQPSVLTALTSGGHRGILPSLMQKSVDFVINDTSKLSVHFAEALISLVTVLVSSSSGCSAMREAGFIPTLLPLLKDINPQHLHLVEKAVRILEAFMDFSNPAAALFRDLGGLDDTISRLKIEVSHVENGGKQPDENFVSSTSAHLVGGSSACLDDMQPLYSEPLISYHRKLLMKALLRAISLGTYAPGNTFRIFGSEENVLPQCLCIIFRRAKVFGGGVFSLAATVLSDLIQKDPTCFPVLDAAGLPSAFLDAIMDDVLNSSEAIACIPQCLDALCLNSNGLQAVKDRNSLRCFVKVFTSRTYLRALTGDTPASLSSGLDELMRHASSLRGPGVDMLVEILETISKIGSATDPPSLSPDSCSSSSAPMEMDGGDKNLILPDSKDSSKPDNTEQIDEPSPDVSATNIESYLPDCVNNVARLLETVLQNADTCRIFVEKKGIEAILQLFTLSLMPPSISVGQTISVAFKNFSPQHYVSLARDVCSFLREHLKSTNEVLDSVGGTQIALVESAKQSKVLKYLSSLEGILALSVFLLKGTTAVVSELSTSDADVLKDIGRTYKEIIWQISLCNDSKTDEKKNNDQEPDISQVPSSTVVERESDDDTNMQTVRYTNPVFARTGSHSLWSGERDFASVVRSGEGLHRRTRQGISRMRGGRTARRLEALNIDSEPTSSAPPEASSSQDLKKKSPNDLALEILNKLASTMRSFFTALVKGFTSPNRRRADSGSLGSASKALGTVLATNFLEALSFSGHSTYTGLETSLSVKCRYLGKVVDDMAALIFDSRRRSCYTAMVNNFYVHGTFKELLTTYEATSQLLWTLPYSYPSSDIDLGKKGEGVKLSHNTWLLYTLQNYCRLLEYFVNSSMLLSPTSASQAELLVQPVAVGLSIGLFPVPRDPEVFVRMLQSQVLDVILPVWNHPMFYSCSPGFIASIISLVTHVYSGVGDVKRNRNNILGSTNQRFMPPPPDEATIATIVEMGFSRARAEEALRRVETNSVEMAMEWLFSHADDPVQEDDELAQALALSLGSSSETTKVDNVEKTIDVPTEEGHMKKPPVDDILAASVRLFQSSDSVAFQLSDLLVTLCNRNKGEDRPKVISYLLQQLKLCPLDFSTKNCALGMLAHVITLLLFEDGSTRDVAAQNGIISTIIDILTNLKGRSELGKELPLSKCMSALLLILDQLLQSRPKTENMEAGTQTGFMPDSSGEHGSLQFPDTVEQEEKEIVGGEKEPGMAFENALGKLTGFATIDESHKLLDITCDLIKQHVPAVVMQAVLQLCARLTKTHDLAMKFLENGGLTALFNLPRNSFFPGYDTVVSAIVRHLLEDPQTLQSAMELEIRQTLSGNRHSGRVSPRSFLTSLAPVISRDPTVFMKAAAAACQLETSGGRTIVVLSKEKEKEKSKSSSTEATNECLRISESRPQDGSGKYLKSHKKVPVNLTLVVDQLLEIVLKYPPMKSREDFEGGSTLMDIDEPTMKVKGKSKVAETVILGSESQRSAELVKVTFVLKLLSDIVLMYGHAVSVILRRDSEMCQFRGSNQPSGHNGIIHHVLHCLLPVSADKSAGPDDWRGKLSEKASWFLVVLCGRSGEGRKRVTNELVKEVMSFSNFESNSMKSSLSPDKRLFSFVDLVYSILSKNSSSGSLPGSGYSPDIAKSLIEGGVIKCLTSILQVVDLDHPDAPKFATLVLKGLECLSRAANASEQILKSDGEKRRSTGLNERSDDQMTTPSVVETVAHDPNGGSQEALRETIDNAHHQRTSQDDHHADNPNQSGEQDMRVEEGVIAQNPQVELGMDFMHEEMGDDGVLRNPEQIEMTFHVENRLDDDMGDEDDGMGDDRDNGDDDEDDDGDGVDEDEDIAEDGGGMMSMADTDAEDHDDADLGDEYNDEMIDEDDDDFHENRVIEVRWREALDGLDHLQILGQPGTAGVIDVASDPFDGVNVDDLFRLQSFERRRQTGRSSFERPASEVNGFQHPLFVRPPQSGDFVSMWSTGGNSASRDSETLSSGNLDVAHFYMFDGPTLPYDHMPSNLFGEHLGSVAPPPLTDYSLGMGSSHLHGRRVLGNGRWTDDGQPQGGTQAAAIAQAVEAHFLAQMVTIDPASNPTDRQIRNSEEQEKQSDALPSHDDPSLNVGADSTSQQFAGLEQENGAETIVQQINLSVDGATCEEERNVDFGGQDTGEESLHTNEPMSVQPLSLNIMPNGLDCTVNEINVTPSDNVAIPQEFVNSSIESSADVQYGRAANELTNNQNVPVIPLVCNGTSNVAGQPANLELPDSGLETPNPSDPSINADVDVDMGGVDAESNQSGQPTVFEDRRDVLLSTQNTGVTLDDTQADQTSANNEASGTSTIDPTFLEALPEDLRAEVLASQQAQSIQPSVYAPPSGEDIDPEFLAALPPDIQAEVLAQQRAQRVAQQAEGHPVDMDNASIIATFPADLREEVLLTSSEAVLSALPAPLLAEAQILRDRAMSHYQARSLFGSSHRLNNRRNGLGFVRRPLMDRGVGVTIDRRSALTDSLKVKEIEGEPLLNANALKALIRLLRLAQPLGKGLLQRLLLNLCAHSVTRATLIYLLLDMIKPETEVSVSRAVTLNSQRLYGCHSNTVYGRSQLLDGLPPLVFRRILEILTYLATNHSAIAKMLFHYDQSIADSSNSSITHMNGKGKEKVIEGGPSSKPSETHVGDVPLVLFLKLLNQPLFLRSTAHLEQVMGLIQVVVETAAAKLASLSQSEKEIADTQNLSVNEAEKDPPLVELDSNKQDKHADTKPCHSNGKKNVDMYNIFLQLPQSDLRNVCSILGREGLSDKMYMLAGEVLKKLASIVPSHRKFFILELSESSHALTGSAVSELVTLQQTNMLGLSAGSMAGAAILRVLQALSSLISLNTPENMDMESDLDLDQHGDKAIIWNLNTALEPLWQELSNCISAAEIQLGQSSFSPNMPNINVAENLHGSSTSPPLPPGTQRLLPFIEAFFVLCEKLQANESITQHDHDNATAREVKESAGCSASVSGKFCGDSQRKPDGAVTFTRFAEKHRRLANAFIRQNPSLLEKSLSMMLKAPRLIDFDNKRAHFRSRIRQQHDHQLSGPLRISVRRAYILEDSYNQLRMRPTQDLKGRLNVQFQGEEGIDAGGLTREWYQLLSRVIFDKGALLFTTVGNNATFQPNPNSVYQTEHLSYFKFVGRVVGKALFDGQLLDVYFTRSFYKHILGVKVTYHDIEAVDPDYYKNLKWMLENDVSDIPDLTFSMDADEEKLILYEKNEVTDYELKPGGRNIRVTEETKHEYVDLVAEHLLTNAIRPQINSFLEGFNEMVPRELISIFNDKELELLISGLPEIDLEDLKANTEYTGYTVASNVVQWFWEVVKSFNKEDMARLLQFVTGTSKVPLEGFKALQGISGPQRFQIHKAYGAPDRLPSAHTCFNQLDLPEYTSKEQLQDRLLLAIHEASEGFGFG